MAVPKKRTSKSRRDMRRSHHALKTCNISMEKSTGELKLSHNLDLVNGIYNGVQRIKVRNRNNS